MPRSLFGLPLTRTGLMLVCVGLAAFACMLTGELMQLSGLRDIERNWTGS